MGSTLVSYKGNYWRSLRTSEDGTQESDDLHLCVVRILNVLEISFIRSRED